jgi:hypothetical protein
MIYELQPITVAARSEAWTVFARSNAGIVSSNPTRGMDVSVRLFCLCFSVRRLQPCDRLIPVQETEKAAKVHKGCRAMDRQIRRQMNYKFQMAVHK